MLESVSYFVPLTLVPLFFFSTSLISFIHLICCLKFIHSKTELSNLPFAVWQTQGLNNYHHVNKVTWTWTWANLGRWWETGGLAYCSPWGQKESDMTGQLNDNNKTKSKQITKIESTLNFSIPLSTCPVSTSNYYMHVAGGMPSQADLTLALLLLLFHLAFRITETYSSLLPLTTPRLPISSHFI